MRAEPETYGKTRSRMQLFLFYFYFYVYLYGTLCRPLRLFEGGNEFEMEEQLRKYTLLGVRYCTWLASLASLGRDVQLYFGEMPG